MTKMTTDVPATCASPRWMDSLGTLAAVECQECGATGLVSSLAPGGTPAWSCSCSRQKGAN